MEEISRRADAVLAGIRPLDGIVALFSHGHFLRVLIARWVGFAGQEGEHVVLGTASRSILGYENPKSEVPAITLLNAGIDG